MPKAGELFSLEVLQQRFADLPPALVPDQARAEATRCLYCFDAPCTRACPTQIDVPKFIRQILHGDDLGAAKTILDANIFGGSCARVCPTEVLCEGACVDNTLLKSPVKIGQLQRFATDVAEARQVHFHQAGGPTGKKVAIVGSGPAGLACAYELRKIGHAVTVFEARDVPGGLNTLGIAAYKISTEFALREVERIRRIDIDIRLNQRLDGAAIANLLPQFDAVVLAIGMGKTVPLGIEGEDLPGVWEALDFIFPTHTKPLTECEVGRRVIVIGAGNTAIDVATAAVRLGAEAVFITYRRTEETIPAFAFEYQLAKADGVHFEWLVQPVRIVAGSSGRVAGVEFVRLRTDDPSSRQGKLTPIPGSNFIQTADMVVKALGQETLYDVLKALPGLQVKNGSVVINSESRSTSIPKLFAAGDCVRGGGEVVDAVQDGKLAARGIDLMFKARA